MRKIKEVLRLRFELGLGQREIARACSISQGAVHSYLKKAAGTGMHWPLPEGWDEKQIEEAVYGKQCSIEESSARAFPDFPALHHQLQQHPHLTLQLVWEEYREKNPCKRETCTCLFSKKPENSSPCYPNNSARSAAAA